jgi:hypothetical protein
MTRFLILLGVLLSVTMSACGTYQEIVFRDEKAAKLGNKVMVPEEGVVADTLRIELMKQGKFDVVSQQPDYVLHISSLLYGYNPAMVHLSGQYSLSVTSRTGEIVFIRVMNAGDMKSTLPITLGEVAQLLL